MGTEALDLGALMRELPATTTRGMPEATRIGHVHLQVADIGESEAFYAGELGLDVTVRSYPGALFLSRDGYHHHVGVNTWAGTGPAGAAARLARAGVVRDDPAGGRGRARQRSLRQPRVAARPPD